VIINAKIIDGTGDPFYYGDIGIRSDRIAAVTPRGALAEAAAKERVDANGLAVSPGFIDIQAHSWNALLFADSRVVGKVAQGVTSEILGEGSTPAPSNTSVDSIYGGGSGGDSVMGRYVTKFRAPHGFGTWLGTMEAHGMSVNAGSFLGAATARAYAMGQKEGPPNAGQLDTMRAVVRYAMKDGAFGMASALIYPPGSYATTEELIEEAKAMAPLHGTYITHMRSEEHNILQAMDEALRIGREGGVPVVIYHFKVSGQKYWPLAVPAIAKVDSARAAGQDVKATMYPYPVSGNNLSACIPGWVHADGKLIERLQDSSLHARIRKEMMDSAPDAELYCQHNLPSAYQIAGFQKPEWKQFEGQRLDAIAKAMNLDWVDAVIALTIGENNQLSKINFSMSEENVAMMLSRPWVVVGSDAGGFDPDTTTELVHPRSYGTFARVLGKYVRDDHVLTLEDAVRKMTWSTAQILGLRDRGLIKEGMFADIVIFDPATVADRATFDNPHQFCEGVHHVIVSGQLVVEDRLDTGVAAGRVLRRGMA